VTSPNTKDHRYHLQQYKEVVAKPSVFGLLFFKEIPDIFSITGASFIIISGYLNYRFKSNI
jgi:drug/metabolite transporter (DMT)-like permease